MAKRVEHVLVPYRDLQLHLEVHEAEPPDAPSIVFSPGMGAYARRYLPLLGKLCDAGFNVVAIDRPGHGLSEGRRGDCTIDQILDVVELVVRYTRERFAGSVGLVGTSLGGIINWYALTREPDVDAVVCHNIASPAISHERAAKLKAPFIKGLAKLAPHAGIPIKQMADFTKISRSPEILELVEGELDRIWCWKLSARFAASMLDFEPQVPWSEVRTPTLVMVGAEDEMVTAAYTEQVLAQGAPADVDVRIVDGLGHMLFFDHLDQTLPELTGWLERTLTSEQLVKQTTA
jgi:alpha-beta hydrolase superfamily lysophospholipase